MPNDDEKPKDSRPYLTGHVPHETFAQFVARVNANSFLMDEPGTQRARKRRDKKTEDVQKVIDNLTEEQRQELLRRL